jgi:hypothetical protein
MHRLAVAVEDSAAAADWFGRTFGAKPFGNSYVPFMADNADVREEIRSQEGSDSRMLWHGGYPFLLLSPFGSGGYVERHLQRWGPGLHSLAWEIEDMWGADARLRTRGLGITGVNIPGRHFFVHPRDTHGVMVEFTDTYWRDDPRRGAPAISEDGGVVQGELIAWVTALVADAEATASLLSDIAGAREAPGLARRPGSIERTVDVMIGDLTIRLVTPLSAESPGWVPFERGPRLYSYSLRVPDLDKALVTLEGQGVPVIGRVEGIATLDPAACFGIPIELTA